MAAQNGRTLSSGTATTRAPTSRLAGQLVITANIAAADIIHAARTTVIAD
ncbi:MAG: hypothetical protein ACP5HZ_01080 [Ferrimicrobium sp.]